MGCPSNVHDLIHRHMDGELNAEEEKRFKEHMQSCEECMKHYQELNKAVAFVQSTSHVHAPADFTANVMKKLPKEKRTVSMNRWFRSHPLLVAASLFILLMTGSLFTSYQEDKFSVTKHDNLVVENHTVIVPEGETVNGNIIVRNGDIKIEGKVNGDVTVINGDVINGDQYLASAGQVTGQIEEVDQLFEWLWFELKSLAKEVVNIFEK
ncbi:anti-sigma factor family protein [Bacillus kexueae]|uniref:anti-sigma factor family protein n=1 Tax=Aeribacillus kexueae TaxID=2078952 RepID=UPI001FAF9B04|nr:anti-sigma factor [Bacillus kexueae]